MILVDTTVWIDFLLGRRTKQVERLESYVLEDEDIAACGVILTEILQGIRSETQYRKIIEHFETFIFLPMEKETFLLAANLYRTVQRRGFTIRSTIDCLIAAIAIENDIKLLHTDKDYDLLENYCGLKTVK